MHLQVGRSCGVSGRQLLRPSWRNVGSGLGCSKHLKVPIRQSPLLMLQEYTGQNWFVTTSQNTHLRAKIFYRQQTNNIFVNAFYTFFKIVYAFGEILLIIICLVTTGFLEVFFPHWDNNLVRTSFIFLNGK